MAAGRDRPRGRRRTRPGDHAAGSRLVARVDQLAEHWRQSRMVDISRPVPDGVRLRRDGRPVTEAATDRALTTEAILAQEGRLLEWAQRRLDAGGVPEPAGGRPIGGRPDARPGRHRRGRRRQRAAGVGRRPRRDRQDHRARTGGRAQLHDRAPGRVRCRPVRRRGAGARRRDRHRRPTRWTSSCTNTPATAARALLPAPGRRDDDRRRGRHGLHPEARATRRARRPPRWRVVLVGDPLQFSAVGRGGMFAHLDRQPRCHRARPRAPLHPRMGTRTPACGSAPATSASSTSTRQHHRIHDGDRRAAERWAMHQWQTARRHGETCRPAGAHERYRRPPQPLAQDVRAGRRRARRPCRRGRPVPAPCRRRDRHPPQRPAPAHRPRPDGPEPRHLDHRPRSTATAPSP